MAKQLASRYSTQEARDELELRGLTGPQIESVLGDAVEHGKVTVFINDPEVYAQPGTSADYRPLGLASGGRADTITVIGDDDEQAFYIL